MVIRINVYYRILLVLLLCLLTQETWADPMHGEMPPGHSMPHAHEHTMEPVTLDRSETSESPAQSMIMTEMMRQGSGTGWQPSDNPMNMWMGQVGPVTTMAHGSVFLDYTDQNVGRYHHQRGSQGFYSQNWIMGSASMPIGQKNIVMVRSMLSLEPLTTGKKGYPLLFQTGEAYNNQPLIDIQHPHDLFMELSAQYLRQLRGDTWLKLYAAASGEPALGPVAFMHRYSAFLVPDAPLGHHIEDSTHVSFGVLTGAVMRKKWQAEASLFNGREPDQYRYDFDFRKPTSFSERITYMPNEHWAFQISHGRLDHPEALESHAVNRLTASAQYQKTWDKGWWANTVVFGHNIQTGPDDQAFTLESTLHFQDKNSIFTRIENVQKTGLWISAPEKRFNITAVSLGAARDLFRFHGAPLTLGGMITLYGKPSGLNTFYGRFPISLEVFLHTNAPSIPMKM